MKAGAAAALVAAGMLSVLLFPLFGLALRKRSKDFTPHPADDVVVADEA